jgi:hypothetical protein
MNDTRISINQPHHITPNPNDYYSVIERGPIPLSLFFMVNLKMKYKSSIDAA